MNIVACEEGGSASCTSSGYGRRISDGSIFVEIKALLTMQALREETDLRRKIDANSSNILANIDI